MCIIPSPPKSTPPPRPAPAPPPPPQPEATAQAPVTEGSKRTATDSTDAGRRGTGALRIPNVNVPSAPGAGQRGGGLNIPRG